MNNPQLAPLPDFEILDCTVRDGTYQKNLKLTADESGQLAALAERTGLDYFETGHGLGIGAAKKAGPAAASDMAYCEIAGTETKLTKWGTFCIAGLCTPEEMQPILRTKPDFVRVGIDPGKITTALPLFDLIKSAGVAPMAFFMKSYAWDRKDIVAAIREARRHGTDVAYIVDSAGTMLPEEVSSLTVALNDAMDGGKIGFHGHNNLGLAVANSIAALRSGAGIIDCSLMGVGRSAGNCPLEQFAFALVRYGAELRLDLDVILDFSETVLPTIYKSMVLTPLDIVIGYSGFHSAFLKKVEVAAMRHGVSIHRLIIELCKITQLDPSEHDLAEAVSRITERKKYAASA